MSRTSQFRTVKRIGSLGLTLAVVLSMTLTGSVIAHTGSITATQDCETYTVTVHLDSNVAAGANWAVTSTIPGISGNGTGPGPADVATFSGPAPVSGTVDLDITFGTEQQHYTKTLAPAEGCAQATPGFTVDKGVSLKANGPFGADLTTTTGKTVHYRITIANTGDVKLTGVSLIDNTYDLAAKGCTVPDTLEIGADYKCDYSATAATGTTTNVATGDTVQTGSDTGTATVVATAKTECPTGQVHTSTNSGSGSGSDDCENPPCPTGQVHTSTNGGGNSGSEDCEAEAAAVINVTKTADDSTVDAGSPIGFTVTLNNTGDGAATGLTFTDVLPTGSGISWSIPVASAGWSIVGNSLKYTPTTLAANTSTSVHVVSTTTTASCDEYKNTATVTWDTAGSSSDRAKISTSTNNGGSEGDHTASDRASATVTVDCPAEAAAVINVTKTADDPTVDAGSPIGFLVTINNTGDGAATGLTFSDSLPTGSGISWSISPASAGWSIVGNSLRYTPTTLAANTSTSVHVVSNTTSASCDEYENTARVTWDTAGSSSDDVKISTSTNNNGEGEHNGGSEGDHTAFDKDSATVTVDCPAEAAALIDVTKTADTASVSAGSQIGFTVTLNNTGDGAATGIVFTDVLPSGSGISWSINPASAGWSIVGSNLVYTPTTLAAHTSTSVHVVSNTTSASCDDYLNTATVTWDSEDSSSDRAKISTSTNNGGSGGEDEHNGDTEGHHTASDAASATTNVLCGAINLTKTADAASVTAGATIGFTITVTNAGPGTATGVHVADLLPTDAGLSWTAGAVTGPNAAGVTCNITAGSLICDQASLPSGGSFSVHLSSPTTDATVATSPVSNTAVVTTTNDGTDDDTDEVVVTPPATAPSLATVKLVKTNDGAFAPTGTAIPGDTLTYQITISNSGTGAATNVAVSDDISTLLARSDYNNDCNLGCSLSAGGVLSWTIPTIAAGGSAVLTFSVDLDAVFPAGETHLTNFVVVNDQGTTCPPGSTAPECGGTDTEVDATPDVNVIKQVATNGGSFGPNSNAVPGDTLNYRITITNVGKAIATNVTASDDIAALLVYGDYNNDCNAGCSFAGSVLSWTVPSIAANGGTAILTFSIDLDTTGIPSGTALPNVAIVVGPGSNCAAESTNPDCDTTTTVSEYQLELTKTNNAPTEELLLPDDSIAQLPTADEGDTVTYTLSYAIGALDVTAGVITDVLPAGLEYVAGSATGNGEFTFQGYNTTTRTLSWTAAAITQNGSVTYQAVVGLGASELSQPLTNVATIDSAETAPDESSSDIFVPVPPLAETNVPTPPSTDVLEESDGNSAPGSSLMLILAVLGMLVIGIGFVTPVPAAVRRRNRR